MCNLIERLDDLITVKSADSAAARASAHNGRCTQWPCSDHVTPRHERSNGVSVGSGIFYAVRADML
jgi:hypothetical protein